MSPSRRSRTSRPGLRRAGAIAFARVRPGGAPRAPGPVTAGSPLTTRAAILVLVVVTVAVSLALPLREYVTQRSQIAAVEAQQAAATSRVAALEQAQRQLADPAYVAAEARRRLHMARPGDITYLVLPPGGPASADAGVRSPSSAGAGSAGPVPPAAPPASAAPQSPWWAQVWGGVAAADRPAAPSPR